MHQLSVFPDENSMGGSLTLRQKCRYLRAAKEAFNKPKATQGKQGKMVGKPLGWYP